MLLKHWRLGLLGLAVALCASGAWAEKRYDPGADDKEIKVGQIGPYSGPASAYGVIGKAIGAYFDKVNAEGGVNGRKIKYLPLDDGYNPAKTVEMARKLVEEEEALLIFNSLGTATNSAIEKYMNAKRVPQLFVATGATKFGNPANHWTMGWQPPYAAEARIYAQHILETRPGAKIALLYQNDDFGKDYVAGFKEGLGAKAASMIVREATYEVTDPTLDSQLLTLKDSGADTLLNITTPKFAAMSIKNAAEIGWKPQTYLTNVSISVSSVMTPAGLQNGTGIITALYGKDPTDPQWANDPGMKDWQAFMKQYYPGGSLTDANAVYGYTVAQTLVQVLRQCGDDLTRENVMKQAANLNLTLPLSLPGVNIRTAPDDYFPIEREQLARFDGKTWVLFGKVYGR